ncbi:Phosphoribosyl-dephospho-CoA transferase [Pararobbsia alpina]|uniref:malonate decarboxylase holo-ACP synthase n=1 Tax=Pararobbsia alpina TaxID=621374 RepID=UPI0039A644B1
MQTLPPIRPHDLLWIADARDLILSEPAPAWLTAGWLAQVPVVVRRELTRDEDIVPVGVRGMSRSERVAGHVNAPRIERRLTPEAVVDGAAQTLPVFDAELPCLRALSWATPKLAAIQLAWGVTGSVGFALATGLPVLRDASDLDVLLRAPRRLTRAETDALSDMLSNAPARIDLQIDTGIGGFALLEWLAGRGHVMLKTDRGPVLVEDPWRVEEVEAALAGLARPRSSMPTVAATSSSTSAPAPSPSPTSTSTSNPPAAHP